MLGYGTEAGGPMKQYTGYDDGTEQGYIQDYSTGADAISRIDEAALGTIADELGVPYIHRDAETTVAEATQGVRVGDVESSGDVPAAPGEFYWIAAIPLAVLALIELAWMLSAVLRSGAGGRARSGRRVSHG